MATNRCPYSYEATDYTRQFVPPSLPSSLPPSLALSLSPSALASNRITGSVARTSQQLSKKGHVHHVRIKT